MDILGSDLVIVRLTLRARDNSTFTLDKTVSVKELGVQVGGRAGKVPSLDSARYAQLLTSAVPADVEEALRMLSRFQDETADYVAAGEAPPADALASAVVDWVVRTKPDGKVFTKTDKGDGYVISKGEINISGPVEMNGERFWRVLAVGTWGN